MLPLRLLLSSLLVCIGVYTGVVIAHHGLDFLSVFVGDIAAFGWPGQFNLDFAGMLVLSAMWVAWRQRYSAAGVVLAVLAMVGGTPFLCVYLLVESTRCGGDLRELLLGSRWERP